MGRRQEPGDPVRTAEVHTAKPSATRSRTAKAGFAEVVLVCGKCAKRQGVDRKRLGRALKRAAARTEGDALRPQTDPKARQKARRRACKVKVVETGCLGPCPKRMLTVATAESLARGRVVLLDPALDALSAQSLSPQSLSPESLSPAAQRLDARALPPAVAPEADD